MATFSGGTRRQRARSHSWRTVDYLRHFDNYKIMETKDVVKALAALAQESRLEVFRLLVKAGEEAVPAGQIAEQLEIPPATLSFHLKELTNAGLIESQRNGRQIAYSLNVKGMRCLLTFLTEECCEGRPELCQSGSNVCSDGKCEEKSRRKKKAKVR